jgi:hypothetical protein
LNHLDWYSNYKWYDIQGAIWLFDTPSWNGQARAGVPALSTMKKAQKMYNDANTYGADYKVPSGGWAGVIFVPTLTPPGQHTASVQIIFVKVNP